nr:MAG TPA: major capsid protein [Caudoviricetes sp.]
MANFATTGRKVVLSDIASLHYLSSIALTVNRDAEAGYERGYGSTVDVAMPVEAASGTRSSAQREARTAITFGDLTRKYVPVKLEDELYSAVRLPSEWLTWTLADFEREVVKPQAEAVASLIPAKLGAVMATVQASQATAPNAAGVAYTDAKALKFKGDGSNLLDVVARANRILNKNKVPFINRTLAVGPGVAEVFRKNKDLLNVSFSADNGGLLRDATIAKVGGFTVIEEPALPEAFSVFYEKNAFALAVRAADVPAGATFGDSVAQDGFALRHICDYDPTYAEDRSVVDAYFGAAVLDARRATAAGLD